MDRKLSHGKIGKMGGKAGTVWSLVGTGRNCEAEESLTPKAGSLTAEAPSDASIQSPKDEDVPFIDHRKLKFETLGGRL